MTSGSVLEQTDWSTSQSIEQCASSYKKGAEEEKTRGRENERERRNNRN